MVNRNAKYFVLREREKWKSLETLNQIIVLKH